MSEYESSERIVVEFCKKRLERAGKLNEIGSVLDMYPLFLSRFRVGERHERSEKKPGTGNHDVGI